jgi:hypothetical protein
VEKIILGLIFTMLFSFSFAYAEEGIKNITVYDDVVKKIVVDGEDKTPGNEKPFVYEGTTYVSLTYMSNILGKKVTWDDQTGTIYLGEVPKTLTVEHQYLTDKKMNYFSNVYLYRIDNSGKASLNIDRDASIDYPDDFSMSILIDPIAEEVKKYRKGISIKAYDDRSSIFYDLDKGYDKLTGIIGFDYTLNKELDEKYIVKFKVDGKIKQEIELKKDGFAESIDVDLSDGERLEIQFVRPEGNKTEPFINLVDLVLEQHIYE